MGIVEFEGTRKGWRSNGLEIRAQSGMLIANVYPHLPSNVSKEVSEANVAVIENSPELLEACQLMKSWIDWKHKEEADKDLDLVNIQKLINKSLNIK